MGKIKNKRMSSPMLSKFRKLFDRFKRVKDRFVGKSESDKFMARNVDNNTPPRNECVCEKNDLQYSKSNVSIASGEDYKIALFQISSLIKSSKDENYLTNFDNMSDCSDDSEIDEKKERFLRMKHYISNYNLFQYNRETEHIFQTQEIKSKKIHYFTKDILSFQGKEHFPDEIAPYCKKDCRTWLWKSVRLQRKQRRIQIATALNQMNNVTLV